MRIPDATYRIQFNLHFRFADAYALVPYLYELGISHLYASPRFKATRGSSHGYDVADPLRINSELGTEEEFEQLISRLQHYGMYLLLDIVPNHMAASAENPWWMDVLENGRDSRYASYFDIDWQPQGAKTRILEENRVLLPVLHDLYGHVLVDQGITLWLEDTGFVFRYGELKFPVNPRTYSTILEVCRETLAQMYPAEQLSAATVRNLLSDSSQLSESRPSESELDWQLGRASELKQKLWLAYQSDASIRSGFDETLRILNGKKGIAYSFDRLDAILSRQAYRLAHWRISTQEINYRRFFDVNELVGLRVEHPEVFDAWHLQIRRLIAQNKLAGVRIDHIDGLYDPRQYLERVQKMKPAAAQEEKEDSDALSLFSIVEKITLGDETLPADWRVAGTTGYDFLNAANVVFIDAKGYADLQEIFQDFTGITEPFAVTTYVRRKQVMKELFAAEVRGLGDRLVRLAAKDRSARDLSVTELAEAFMEITASLSAYRTYVRSFDISARDRAILKQTLVAARRRLSLRAVSRATFAFLRRVFLLDPPSYAANEKGEWLDFLMRWQQFTGSVMAKGLEDTTLFIQNALLSLNEVGSNPFRETLPFGALAFHQFNRARLARWPHTLNATSTHDTKWSEDVRARVDVLSELPEEWRIHLNRWASWNQSRKKLVGGQFVPTRNEEILIYQALLGILPMDQQGIGGLRSRMETFIIKAVREAKTNTNWLTPNEEHEQALRNFLTGLLDPSAENRFLPDFLRFHRQVAFFGACNALSQVLLKITSPGIPDFYQGCETWVHNLTDPDNRRPVDFKKRRKLLEEFKAIEARKLSAVLDDLYASWQDGRLKLFMVWKALNYRRMNRDLFWRGEYIPVEATGKREENVCAFARYGKRGWMLVAVPRLVTQLVQPGTIPIGRSAWGSHALILPQRAPQEWQNIFTGEPLAASRANDRNQLPLRNVFRQLPFALLSHKQVP